MAGGNAFDQPRWTDAAAYAWLLATERAGFAWEWLRRSGSFQQAALEALNRRDGGERGAGEWGLHAFEDPRRSFLSARPLWTAERHPWVLDARARRAGPGDDAIDFRQLFDYLKVIQARDVARVLLSDGYRTVRLDLHGPFERGALVLDYHLSGLRSLFRPLLVLNRLRSLALAGRFSQSLHPKSVRAVRMVQLLRAHDGLGAGATHADLAETLLTSTFIKERWRVHSPSLRSRAQRLAHDANRMANGGFWSLLQ